MREGSRDRSGLRIVGLGRALPASRVTSGMLDASGGHAPGHVEAVTGVATRYFCEHESQIDLAVAACRAALANADIAPGDVDCLIAACAVGYQPIPATAPVVMTQLGLGDGTCFGFDVNATCLSFPAALQVADGLLAGGRYRTILVVSAEIASRALPFDTQPEVAGLFGDGAGAAVLRRGAESRMLAARFTTHPSAVDTCRLGAGGTRYDFMREHAAFAADSVFQMDARALFKLTARHMSGFIEALLQGAGCRHDDIDLVVPHQASPGALAHMVRSLGFAVDRVVDIAADHGNQIAASIPFALDHARAAGRLVRGDRVLLVGTSAGVSFGGLVLDY